MTEHPAFAALPVPCNAAFQEHSGAGSEQVHAVFGSGVQCFGPVIYQALCTSMLGKELSTGVVNMGLGEPGPPPSYVPAEVLPVPEGYVPSTIDESAQQQKWGSRIGGEHHGAGLWHLYSTLAAPLASCCLLRRRRRLGCGSSECRWLTPAIYTSLAYEHKCLPSPSHTGLTLLSTLAPSSPPREDQACPRAAGALQTA